MTMSWSEEDRLARERLRAQDPDEEPDGDDEEEEEEEERKPADEDERLAEKVLKTRTILISEAITDEVARRVFQQLLVLEAESAEKPITVIVNSPGGEADSGFGIFDMLRFVAPPVRTLVAGLCASAAVIVFLAGEKGERLSLPHSRFMMHQPSSASFGQASDLQIASAEIVRLRERYNRIVSELVGKDLDTVRRDADRDFWLSAEEAQGYGLVDRLVYRREELEKA
jgi:ATP-dependent Clp protease protease subunit